MYREQEVVRTLWQLIDENVVRHRIELVRGQASFEDAHTVHVRGDGGIERRLTAPVILVATGSRPHWPDGVARDPARLYDSDTILKMDRIPRSLVVVGGGVIGCEYATTFRALGIDVTLVTGGDRLLPFLDREIADRLTMQIGLLGVEVVPADPFESLTPRDDHVDVRLRSGVAIASERVLFAAGRLGATGGLELEKAGLSAGPRGHLEVNANFQTAVAHIYAAGDVIGFPALASTSMEQARVAMCHAFDLRYKDRVSSVLPMAVYTIPEIAAVGETEESCRQKGIRYAVGRAEYRRNSRGQIIGDLSGLVKLVFRLPGLELLGVHILGEMASELVHVGQACLGFGGTIDYFIQAVFNYPTLGEAYKYAAYDGLGNASRALQDEAAAER